MIKVCKHCHKEYEYIPSKRNYTYCSKECAYNGNMAIAKEKRIKAFVPEQKKCQTCGKEFTTVYGGSKAYCSDWCKQERQRRTDQRNARIEEHAKERRAVCKHCGKPFTREYHAHGMKQFCCKKCYADYVRLNNENNNIPLRLTYQCICEHCGKPFETDRIQKKYCSQECKYKASIQKGAKRQHDRNVANYKPRHCVCKECGKEFTTTFGDRRNSFCSIECNRLWNNREVNRNREIRMRGALVDKDITLKKVAERDNNVCYLCGYPVDWSDCSVNAGAFLVGPNYPSIDHVFPIAKGGKHEWNNVRLAHCHCNSTKRDNLL